MAIFEKSTQRLPSVPPAPPGSTARGTVVEAAPPRPREQDTESDATPRRPRRRNGNAMTSVALKLTAAQLERIEAVVAAVQDMAQVRKPDKNDVLVWMLSSVSAEDLRDKLAQWNKLFE